MGDLAAAKANAAKPALAAARALMSTDKNAEDIVRSAMSIAAEICIYTNNNLTCIQACDRYEGCIYNRPVAIITDKNVKVPMNSTKYWIIL